MTCERFGKKSSYLLPLWGRAGWGLALVPAAIGLRVPRPPAPNACLPVWIPLLTAVCRLGKARSDSESVGLREAGLDPVGHAGMLPNQRVGRHAQRHGLTLTPDFDIEHVRLAGYPPARVAMDRDFLGGCPLAQALHEEARVEVASELRDQQPQR